MAKIPTSRIILYVVLAIVVIVVGIWMLRTRAQESKMGKRVMEAEDIGPFVKKAARQIENVESKLARFSGPEVDQANQLLSEARAGLQEIQSLTEPPEITKKRDEIMDKIGEARKLARKAKGGGD